jgi:hypothetical protein
MTSKTGITARAGTAETNGQDVPALPRTGRDERPLIERQQVRTGRRKLPKPRLQLHVPPRAVVLDPSEMTGRVFSAETNRSSGLRSNRLPSRSIFSRRNALFQKSSNRLSKGTWPIHYLDWLGCFWNAQSGIGSAFVHSTITQ